MKKWQYFRSSNREKTTAMKVNFYSTMCMILFAFSITSKKTIVKKLTNFKQRISKKIP